MLSYRHAFHAGNHADVLKHLVLVNCLEYLIQKPAPILYIDTHAGAGRYALDSAMLSKTEEYVHGAGALAIDSFPNEFASYGRLLEQQCRQNHYPGSPLLASELLREQDRLLLFELHSNDYLSLQTLFARDKRIKAERSDGFHALKARLPAQQKRALGVTATDAGAIATDTTAVGAGTGVLSY